MMELALLFLVNGQFVTLSVSAPHILRVEVVTEDNRRHRHAERLGSLAECEQLAGVVMRLLRPPVRSARLRCERAPTIV